MYEGSTSYSFNVCQSLLSYRLTWAVLPSPVTKVASSPALYEPHHLPSGVGSTAPAPGTRPLQWASAAAVTAPPATAPPPGGSRAAASVTCAGPSRPVCTAAAAGWPETRAPSLSAAAGPPGGGSGVSCPGTPAGPEGAGSVPPSPAGGSLRGREGSGVCATSRGIRMGPVSANTWRGTK